MNLTYAKALYLFVLISALLFQPTPIAKAADSSTRRPCSSGGYCGLYCLYAAMKLCDVQVSPADLIKPEYIGSHEGSSLAELKKAAEDNRMHAAPVAKLTSSVLRHCPYPVILHVKSDATSKTYDHYELFLGTENNQAKLFDPPDPPRLVPFYELTPRWDGTGLIVSAKPSNLGAIFAPARRQFMMYAAIAAAAVLAVHRAKRWWLPSVGKLSRPRLLGLSIAQAAGLSLAALLCGMVYNFANDEGFLAHPNATAPIQQAHLDNFIPKVSNRQVRGLLNSNTVFIDARYTHDFESSHLQGAINIPVHADEQQRQEALAHINKDRRIVVYCQSANCKFAEKVAIRLVSDGFANVSIFKGDWQKLTIKTNK